MTPEERARTMIHEFCAEQWDKGYEATVPLWFPEIHAPIAQAIRAAVAEALSLAEQDRTRAVAAEREACAVEADRHGGYYPIDVFPEPMPGKHGDTVDACSARAARHSADTIAAAIRARGTVPCPSRPGLGPSGTARCGGEAVGALGEGPGNNAAGKIKELAEKLDMGALLGEEA